MAAFTKRFAAGALVALVVVLAASVSATPDPSLCPFELGYNPTFNADGTVLSCTKGQETFQVDEAGILANSLRGIGTSAQALLNGFATKNLTVLAGLTEPTVEFELPDGPHVVDAAVVAFILNTFTFPPGADTTAVAQISQYHFLDNNDPRTASIHSVVFGAQFTTTFDSIWRFNLVNGQRVWQLAKTYNLQVVPV